MAGDLPEMRICPDKASMFTAVELRASVAQWHDSVSICISVPGIKTQLVCVTPDLLEFK